MLSSSGCQSSLNYPVNCPNGRWYQPPLPYNVTIGGASYDQVIRNDIDCSEDLWSGPGACTYDWCRALENGEAEAALVMSFPFIIAAGISPFIGYFVDKVNPNNFNIQWITILQDLLVNSLDGELF